MITPLNFKERMILERYAPTSESCRAISLILKRGKNTVVTEYRRTGGRQNYTAEIGQKYADDQRSFRSEHLSKLNAGQETPYISMRRKMEDLEMQIEILCDTIKQLREKNDSKD